MCRTELLVSDLHWISWYQLRVFGYFRLVSTSGLWILIGFTSLDFNRYQFDSFGFELVSALGLGFWIGIGFGSLDLIGISSGSLGFGSVGFTSLDISDRTLDFGLVSALGIGFEYLDFGSVSTSDPWFYILNRLISFEYWMDDFFRILDG
ncbi:unnamed protein product [Rhizophagus irregularis]|nr:unnamed protein product [Rhizophagus irregularis]